jgi:hypothetical protein
MSSKERDPLAAVLDFLSMLVIAAILYALTSCARAPRPRPTPRLAGVAVEGFYHEDVGVDSLTPFVVNQFWANLWPSGIGNIFTEAFSLKRMATRRACDEFGDTISYRQEQIHRFGVAWYGAITLPDMEWITEELTIYGLPDSVAVVTAHSLTAEWNGLESWYCCGNVDSLRTSPGVRLRATLTLDGKNGWRDTVETLGEQRVLRVGAHRQSGRHVEDLPRWMLHGRSFPRERRNVRPAPSR